MSPSCTSVSRRAQRPARLADIVRFNAIDPSANNVGVLDRNSPPMIALVNLPAIVLDGVNPTLTVVPEVVHVPTDAGSLVGAVIALPDLNPADNCDISPTVTRITTLPNGSTTTAWPAEFPIGVRLGRVDCDRRRWQQASL